MQLPDMLIKESFAIEILNTVGLGMLGIGIGILYRALVSKSKLLSENITEIRTAYESAMTIMKKRADEIDLRFEDEKKFRALYLSIVEDAEEHKKKIKEWKEDELLILQNKMRDMAERLKKVEDDFENLTDENHKLRLELIKLQNEYKMIKTQNEQLAVELGVGRPTVKM